MRTKYIEKIHREMDGMFSNMLPCTVTELIEKWQYEHPLSDRRTTTQLVFGYIYSLDQSMIQKIKMKCDLKYHQTFTMVRAEEVEAQ